MKSFKELDLIDVKTILEGNVELPNEVSFPVDYSIHFVTKDENFIHVDIFNEQEEKVVYRIFLMKGYKIEIHCKETGVIYTPNNWGALILSLMESGFSVTNE
mgnify:CR=1 FL=1